MAVVPKPRQRPTPPIRIAATSIGTYAAIGTQRHPIFVVARLGTLSELAPLVRGSRAAGHSGVGEACLRVLVYLTETEGRARHEPEQSVMHLFRAVGVQLEAATLSGARAIKPRARRGQ